MVQYGMSDTKIVIICSFVLSVILLGCQVGPTWGEALLVGGGAAHQHILGADQPHV